jgi:tRNA-Thr(GGU) m(6)t(6)A37 methyltransferase TsaA
VAKARDIVLVPIGHVESSLTDAASAPKQGHEGSPPSSIVFEAAFAEGLAGFEVGGEMLVLTWLDRAARDVLRVIPRDDPRNPETGVFRTRSPARPNPVGLHRVRIESIDGLRFGVRDLEALDGTPVVDVKPPLDDWER